MLLKLHSWLANTSIVVVSKACHDGMIYAQVLDPLIRWQTSMSCHHTCCSYLLFVKHDVISIEPYSQTPSANSHQDLEF